MQTLATLQAQRDALAASRVSGVLVVKDQNGESVTYKSDADMAAALRWLDEQITILGGQCPPKTIIFKTSKGL